MNEIFPGMDYIPHEKSYYNKKYDANARTTRSIRYYDRYLLEKAESVFKWTVPKEWDLNYFLLCLYVWGFVCILPVKPYGVIPQYATIYQRNIYYNPASAIVNNPYFKEGPTRREVKLGEDAELIHLRPDYCGIMDCVNEYSEMLANASCAVNTNLYNSRMSYVFYAKNKAQAESLKKMYDKIGTGAPAVIIDKQLQETDVNNRPINPYQPFNAQLKANYITTDVLEDMRRIEHMFAQKIGLPNSNTEKKERMTMEETDKTDFESCANVILWKEMIDESLERVNKKFDLNLKCEWRYDPLKTDVESEVFENGNTE